MTRTPSRRVVTAGTTRAVSRVTTPADTHASFAELALHLYEEPTVPETVDRVLDFARSAVNCSHATVLFVHGRKRIETVASTDPVLAELDGRQMELGEGPDLTLAQGGDDVIVRDIGEDVRWPLWHPSWRPPDCAA